MKKNLLIISALFIMHSVHAQFPTWVWAKSTGGPIGEACYTTAVDASNNIFIAGEFSGTSDFDPGTGTFNITSAGVLDVYVSKLDASGNFLWAKAWGDTTDQRISCIATDASGNVYIIGHFRGTVDFDPGAGIFSVASNGFYDIFISKLDASGNFVWAKTIGGAGYDYGNFITVTASGNVYTTGTFTATVDFDPGAGVFNLIAVGNNDVFVSKLNLSGNFIWARAMGGNGGDFGNSIAINPTASEEVYTTGFFNGSSDFDPGSGTYYLNSSGSNDMFVSKLDSSGIFVWAKKIGGGGQDYGNCIAIDPSGSGDVYTTGYFTGTADFDPGAAAYNLTASGNLSDIFISRLDASGNFVWAKSMGGTVNDVGSFILPDALGNVFITGYFGGMPDFDPGAGVFNLTSAGDHDIYLAKFDSSGNFIWAIRMGSFYADYGYSLALDANGKLILAGFYKSPTISFGAITLTNTDNTGFYPEIYVAKLDTITNIPTSIIKSDSPFISLSPNPFTTTATIKFSHELSAATLRVYNMFGELVIEQRNISGSTLTLTRGNLAGGVYVYEVWDKERKVAAGKAVVY